MSTASYNCPCCCGGPLKFSGESGKLECTACGNSFEPETLEMLNASESGEQISFDRPKEGFQTSEDGVRACLCKNCGAELLTENTTAAAECPYCGSPTILPDRIEDGVKPEKVIPFVVSKEQAQNYFKGKKLLPNVFLNSRNLISEMRRLYIPYWLFSCDACADMVYDAEKVHTEQKGEWEITRTKHYLVRRRGGMRFENIPVDGSVKMDDKLTESLEPYDLSAAIPFQSAVLAGAMADHADADCDACEKRAVERSVEQTMLDTVRDYDTVSERSRRIIAERGSATPALLPVWLMTTVKEGKTYTFAPSTARPASCDVRRNRRQEEVAFVGRRRIRRRFRRRGADSCADGCAGQRLAADRRYGCNHHRAGGRRRAEGAAEADGAAERGGRLCPGGVLPPGCERRPFFL